MPTLLHLGDEMIGATWRASLLIALIFCLRPFLVRWLPLRVLPWLWLVVAMKLLLISAPAGWWSLYNLTTLERFFHAAPALPIIASPSNTPITTADTSSSLPIIPVETWPTASLLSLVWLLGAILLAAMQISAALRFHRQVAREGRSLASPWQPLFDDCARSVGIKTPQLVETHAIGAPAVIGLFHPQLLIPHGLLDHLSPEETRLVFIHELSHLRRRDLWLLVLFAVARTVHWFNPLVWLAERALRADCEAACDAAVLRLTFSPAEDYGQTLLRLTQLSSPGHHSVLVAAISTNSNQTQRRLRMIMHYRKSSLGMILAALVLVLITGAFTLPNEVSAQETAPAPSPIPPSSDKPDRALLRHKLDSILIDKVDFNKTDITDVVAILQAKSKELDPDKVGINFVLRLPSATEASPKNQIHRQVSLTLNNVSVADVLQEITAQTNLQYSVEDYAVYLRPARDESDPLTVRTFLVPAHFFGPLPPASTDGKVDVTNQLTSRGFRFPVGATATFLPASNKMVVRNTPAQLDLLATMIDQMAVALAGNPATINKLRSLSLPLDLKNVSLTDAINFLSMESKWLDPDHQGVSFTIDPQALAAAKHVTASAKLVTLGLAVTKICESAGVSCALDHGVVQISLPPAPSTAPAQAGDDVGQATARKLQSLIIPKVNFDKLDIATVLQFLATQSQELDPDKKGINFVLGNYTDQDHVHRPVSITLNNASIADILNYTVNQTNLSYTIKGDTVLLKPPKP